MWMFKNVSLCVWRDNDPQQSTSVEASLHYMHVIQHLNYVWIRLVEPGLFPALGQTFNFPHHYGEIGHQGHICLNQFRVAVIEILNRTQLCCPIDHRQYNSLLVIETRGNYSTHGNQIATKFCTCPGSTAWNIGIWKLVTGAMRRHGAHVMSM